MPPKSFFIFILFMKLNTWELCLRLSIVGKTLTMIKTLNVLQKNGIHPSSKAQMTLDNETKLQFNDSVLHRGQSIKDIQ